MPTLVTMGFRRFDLWDPDIVEDRNMASTLIYRDEHLFAPKVEVVADYLNAHGAEEVTIHQEEFSAEADIDSTVVISGVDSMSARREVWEAVQDSGTQIYLDGRIGGEFYTLLIVDPLDGGWYERKFLFDDEQAAPLPCTQRAIVYPAVALGTVMASQLARWSRGEAVPKRIEQHMGDLFFQTVGSQVI